MKRRLRALCLTLSCLLVCAGISGCENYNYNEPEDLQFAIGIAVDHLATGQMEVTVECKVSGGSENPKPEGQYLDLVGENFSDALNSNLMVTDRSLYWNQMQLVVVSEEVAQKYMTEVLDTLMRQYNMNMRIHIVVSKMPTAREVLLLDTSGSSNISSDLIVKSIKNQVRLGSVPQEALYEFFDDSQDEGRSATLPTVQVYDQDPTTLKIAGSAVFNNVWLAGYLSEDETRTMLSATNRLKLSQYSLPPSPTGAYSNAAVEVMPEHASIVPTLDGDQLTVDIRLEGEFSVRAINGASDDATHQQALLEDLQRNIAMTMENDIRSLLEKSKTMDSADILAIGSIYKDKHGQEWKEINGRWRDIYRSMKVNVAVSLTLRNTGLVQEPIKNGD